MKLHYDKEKKLKDKASKLWQEIFHDPAAYADFYFDQVYPNNKTLIVEDTDLIAMTHLNPYQVFINGQTHLLHYIVGVATDPQYRRQGIMRKMIEKVLIDMADDDQLFTFLMPAKEAYYTPFQFAFGYDRYSYDLPDVREKNIFFEQTLDMDNIDSLVGFCQAYWQEHFTVAPIRDSEYFLRLQKEVQTEGGAVQLLYDQSELVGFYSYSVSDETMYIRELITIRNYDQVMDCLCGNGKQIEIMLDWFNYRDGAKKKPMIMFRILNVVSLLNTIQSDKEQSIVIKVVDPLLKHNDKTFLWHSNQDGSTLEETSTSPEVTIAIADLTQIIFNYDTTNKGSKHTFFDHIMTLDQVFISEIV